MWGPMLRKRRQGSLEDAEWPGGAALPAAAPSWKGDRIARFKQQTLSSYTVTFSPRLVIGIYFCIALLFIPLGASVIAGSAGIRATPVQRYGHTAQCLDSLQSPGNNFCTIQFEVPQDIPAPSYLFYVITNMHQNLREYVKSRSDLQLRGRTPTKADDVKDCYPMLYKEQFANRSENYLFENPLDVSEILNPCGLTAASNFNDTFTLCADSNCKSTLRASRKGIAWRTDIANKFRKGTGPDFTPETNKLVMDEAFLVWMRLSAFSRVEKLYARIEERIPRGKYYMRINSVFPVDSFRGRKHFFISSTKWFGTRNHFLGVLYTTVGVLALVVALIVLATHVLYPRPPAHFDPDRIRGELAKLSLGQMN